MNATLKLLIIEDETADFLLLQRHLRQHGLDAQCRQVKTVQELTAAVDADGWDVVLSDYHVPGIAFEHTLALFRDRFPDLPFILVSGSVGEEKAVELLRQGAWDFILKGSLARLVPSIQRCLREAAESRARREAEQALRESEAKFRSYIEHAPMGVAVFDSEAHCVEGNPATVELLGYDAASLRQMRIIDLVLEEGREEAERSFAKLVREGDCAVECRIRKGDGSRIWVGLRAVRIGEDRFLAFGKDITRRKEDEARLRQAAAVFTSTQEGVVITDLAGRALASNPAFTTITEYTEDEIRGHNLRLLKSGRQERDFYQAMWHSILNAGFWQGEVWNRRKGGEIYPQWLTISTVHDEDGKPVNYVGVYTDISRIKHSTTHLEHLAHHDALTDLPNRLLLLSRLNHTLDRIRRNGGRCAVLFIDLDRFKQVNDTLGHRAGDELLQQVASRILEHMRDADTLARMGGDEFIAVLEDLPDQETAAELAQSLIDRLCVPFRLADGHTVEIGASIGISFCPEHGDHAELLIQLADLALYDAKEAGRNCYRFFQDKT